MFSRNIVSLILLTVFCLEARPTPTETELETAFSKGQWDATTEISYEMLIKNPNASLAKLRGAYSLFQRGYFNAALLFLKMIGHDEWKKLPSGLDRLAEIISLFQKK